MRTGGTLNNTTTSGVSSAQHSPWHSPVPYLFGGLAAMLGLIAFALLVLACSYWKLSGYLENGDSSERDLENGDEKAGESVKAPPVFEEKIVVIMAGDMKPTFLATPISSRASSFGYSDGSSNSDGDNSKKEKKEKEEEKTEKSEMGNIQEQENREMQGNPEQSQ